MDEEDELIEFVNAGTDDFELRSNDLAVFSYLNNEVALVQNITLKKDLWISKPATPWE